MYHCQRVMIEPPESVLFLFIKNTHRDKTHMCFLQACGWPSLAPNVTTGTWQMGILVRKHSQFLRGMWNSEYRIIWRRDNLCWLSSRKLRSFNLQLWWIFLLSSSMVFAPSFKKWYFTTILLVSNECMEGYLFHVLNLAAFNLTTEGSVLYYPDTSSMMFLGWGFRDTRST